MSETNEKRLRLVGWNVQPVLMVDDGEHLAPLEVQGQMIPASQWEAFKDGGDATAIEGVQRQLDGEVKDDSLETRTSDG